MIQSLLMLLTLPAVALGQAAELQQTRGGARLSVATPTNTSTLRLSDLVVVSLEVTLSGEMRPVPMDEITKGTAWRLYKKTPLGKRAADKGDVWHQTFWLAPLSPGDVTLQVEPWPIDAGKGTRRVIAWDPIKLKVTTVVTEVDVAKARDITSIEELPPAPSGWLWWPVAAAGAAVLCAAGVVVGKRWRRTAPQPPATPRQRALTQLDRLVARRLPEKNAVARYLSMLTSILRRYLERTLDIPARKLTTAELIPALTADPQVDPETARAVQDVLQKSDLIRFARRPASPVECEELAGLVRQVLTLERYRIPARG